MDLTWRQLERLGAELRSLGDLVLDQIPTGVTKHCKARTDGVSSSERLCENPKNRESRSHWRPGSRARNVLWPHFRVNPRKR